MTPHAIRSVPRPHLAVLYVVVCLIWGTTWYGMKLTVESVPPVTAAGLRFAVAFPFLLVATFAVTKAALLPPPGRRWIVPFIAVVYVAVPYALINYGTQYISSGLTALLFSSVVVFLLIFSVLISRISVRPMQWLGVLIGLACLLGIVQLTADISARGLLAPAAVLLAAVLHALTYAVLGRYGGTTHVLTQETLPIGLGAAGLLVVGVLVERPDFGEISTRSFVGLLYLGLVASVIGFAAYLYLIKHINAVIVSYVFVIFPVVALLGSALLENATLPGLAVGMAALMLVGFALTMKARPAVETSEASPDGGPGVPEPAGTASPVWLPPGWEDRVLPEIYGYADAAYPAEACGFIHASGEIRPARNVADEMHLHDPEAFPRGETTGYVLAPEDMRYLEDHIDTDDPVVVLYHSHPNGRAYFSAEDRRHALLDGAPVYPTLRQLVVGVDSTGVREARLFQFAAGDYVEQAWFPGAGVSGRGGEVGAAAGFDGAEAR